MNGNSDNDCSWFLIHTKPRQEERTRTNLQAWKVETLSPLTRDWRYNQYSGERSDNVKPLFSGYVFARFNLERLFHKVRYTRGVHELVGFGDGPLVIDDEIIELIRSRIGKDGFVRIGNDLMSGEDDLMPGDKVVIKNGVLKDFTGVFEREMKDSERVELLLQTVSYQAHVQVHRNQLRKLSDSECHV
jgi:transcriptional antiterminator RfaH